jgi:hypothetical protein
MRLLALIADEPANLMSGSSLATVFGPTLLRPETETAASMLADVKHVIRVIESIIQDASKLFPTDDSNQVSSQQQQRQRASPRKPQSPPRRRSRLDTCG